MQQNSGMEQRRLEDCPLDDALLLRVGEFEGQLMGWRQAGRVGIPLLVLPDAPLIAVGRCVSCGEAAPGWRCGLCRAAAELVLELVDVESERFVPPRPMVHAVITEVEENRRDRDFWRTEP